MVTKAKRDAVVRRILNRAKSAGLVRCSPTVVVACREIPPAMEDDDDGFDVPFKFLLEISADEVWGTMMTNEFDAKVCRKLWKFLGRTDEPPMMLHVGITPLH